MSTVESQFPPKQKESQQQNYYAQYGWECPRCGQINAPWVSHCDCKKNYYNTTDSSNIKTTATTNTNDGWVVYDPQPGWAIYSQDTSSSTAEKAQPDRIPYYICKEK